MILYKGFAIKQTAFGGMYKIGLAQKGGFLSPQLQGTFTSMKEAQKAIDNYKPVRPRENTPTIKNTSDEVVLVEDKPKKRKKKSESAE